MRWCRKGVADGALFTCHVPASGCVCVLIPFRLSLQWLHLVCYSCLSLHLCMVVWNGTCTGWLHGGRLFRVYVTQIHASCAWDSSGRCAQRHVDYGQLFCSPCLGSEILRLLRYYVYMCVVAMLAKMSVWHLILPLVIPCRQVYTEHNRSAMDFILELNSEGLISWYT